MTDRLILIFPWQPEMRRAGPLRAALYLVRPDGYIALADPRADPERLREYAGAGMVGRFVAPDDRLMEPRHAEVVAVADQPPD